MASREEEKAARRQARLDAEAEAARTAGRQRRIQFVASGALLAVIVIGALVLVLGGGGGDDDQGPKTAGDGGGVTLPKQQIKRLAPAAKAAQCTVANPPLEGAQHENKTFTEADYKTNPPTSGAHFPQWADDGIYTAGTEPQLGELVHTLEHGRIDVQYKPGTSAQVVKQLEAFVAENDGYHMVMFQNTTGMQPEVAFTAWGHSLTCDAVTDKTWDAARAFRDAYIDQGPEKVP